MVLKRVFNRLKNLAVISSLLVLGLFLLGARPGQGGVPPQPYGANFFSGIVTFPRKHGAFITKISSFLFGFAQSVRAIIHQ